MNRPRQAGRDAWRKRENFCIRFVIYFFAPLWYAGRYEYHVM